MMILTDLGWNAPYLYFQSITIDLPSRSRNVWLVIAINNDLTVSRGAMAILCAQKFTWHGGRFPSIILIWPPIQTPFKLKFPQHWSLQGARTRWSSRSAMNSSWTRPALFQPRVYGLWLCALSATPDCSLCTPCARESIRPLWWKGLKEIQLSGFRLLRTTLFSKYTVVLLASPDWVEPNDIPTDHENKGGVRLFTKRSHFCSSSKIVRAVRACPQCTAAMAHPHVKTAVSLVND